MKRKDRFPFKTEVMEFVLNSFYFHPQLHYLLKIQNFFSHTSSESLVDYFLLLVCCL